MKKRFILYRILGNDLPPRHCADQTLNNVKFIFEHEPRFAEVENRWILNRIVDTEVEHQLVQIFRSHRSIYHVIPFRDEEYRLLQSDRDRLHYITNVNSARNIALAEGRSDGEWVMPFDGQCVFSREGWEQFLAQLNASDGCSCLGVRHVRLSGVIPSLLDIDPNLYCHEDTYRDSEDYLCVEPQLAFRNDADLLFDEDRFYGDMDKAEVLVRLGVPGIWQEWALDQDIEIIPGGEEKFSWAGHVYRLYSGNRDAEIDSIQRRHSREEGLARLLKKISRRP